MVILLRNSRRAPINQRFPSSENTVNESYFILETFILSFYEQFYGIIIRNVQLPIIEHNCVENGDIQL